MDDKMYRIFIYVLCVLIFVLFLSLYDFNLSLNYQTSVFDTCVSEYEYLYFDALTMVAELEGLNWTADEIIEFIEAVNISDQFYNKTDMELLE
jgi:hypothetical protein